MRTPASFTCAGLAFLAGVLLAGSQGATGVPGGVTVASASTSAQIKQLQQQVKSLSGDVARLKRTKADATDLAQVAQGVILNTTSMQTVNPALNSMQSVLTSLQSSVTALAAVVAGKAAKSDLALKADKTALDELAVKVAALTPAK